MIDLNPNVEKIEKVGDIKKYKSSATSVRGIVLGLIQKFNNDVKKGKIYSVKELQMLFGEVLNKINELETRARVPIKSWKGKSGIKIFVQPDSFDIIRYRKIKGGEPKEVKKNI